MSWRRAAPGIILVLVKFTGTSLFLVFILQTTSSLPEDMTTVPARVIITSTVEVPLNVPRWEGYGGSEYWFSEVKDVWFNSQSECSEWDSDLVIIHDREELEFIRNKTTTADYFIGLTYSEDKNKWQWNDGREPKWNLFTRKPNEMGKDCATIRAGNVSPVSCYQESHWICKKKKNS